jgi:hypothetical protein
VGNCFIWFPYWSMDCGCTHTCVCMHVWVINHINTTFLLSNIYKSSLYLNVAIYWDLAQCSPYVNWCFEGRYNLHPKSWKSSKQEASMQQVARQVIHSSEALVPISTVGCCIPDDGSIHKYRFENPKFYRVYLTKQIVSLLPKINQLMLYR